MDFACGAWLWGHPADSLYGHFGLDRHSDVDEVEGAAYLGARNIFFVPMGLTVDADAKCRAAANCPQIGWSLEGPEGADALIELAARHPNLKRAVLDDFLNEENAKSNYTRYTPETLHALRDRLHGAGLSMWMVLYTKQFDRPDLRKWIEPFDGVSMWFWDETDTANFDARAARFFELTRGKRRLIGCYLYDFGGEKAADAALVVRQLEKHRAFARSGETEGVILHTNAVCGMGCEATAAAARFLRENRA